MAAILRTPANLRPSQSVVCSSKPFETPRTVVCFSFKQRRTKPLKTNFSHVSMDKSIWVRKFLSFAASGEATETDEVEEIETQTQTQENIDADVMVEESDNGEVADADVDEKPKSAIMGSLQAYKEALASNDESKVAELEALLQSLEDEKKLLANKVVSLSAELSTERDRVYRISADFENFRKRTERDRLSLVNNVRGEVVETMLPVLDNFERAKSQIKVETEGEEKINNSYQNLCKQFQEILGSLGVVAVETVGNAFDPMLHEAIMREESSEFEEGIVLQEFRKGFKLGERLLRPTMVKVSAGPGPAKSEEATPIAEDAEDCIDGHVESSADEESV